MQTIRKQGVIVGAVLLASACVIAALFFVRGEEVAQTPAPKAASTTPVSVVAGDDAVATTSDEYSFIDLDPKLHVFKDATLDPALVTIDYNLRDVTLCGATYKVKQVFVDGVDVVQRLATILAADERKSEWYCKKLFYQVSAKDSHLASNEELTLVLGQDGRGVFVALYFGTKLPKGLAGYPTWVYPDDNKIVGNGDFYFGSLR